MRSPLLDPAALLAALTEEEVDFVLIGGLAVGVHSEVRPTADVDIMVAAGDEQNRKKLTRALEKLQARKLPGHLGGVEIPPDDPYPTVAFATRYGKLDVLYRPDGSDAYTAIKHRSVIATVNGRRIAVVGRDDLIQMKLAVGRPNDLTDVANLTAEGRGDERRVVAAMRVADGADAEWTQALADERVKLFDPRGRTRIEGDLLIVDAVRRGLTDSQLDVWAHSLAERLVAAGVVADPIPSIKISDPADDD